MSKLWVAYSYSGSMLTFKEALIRRGARPAPTAVSVTNLDGNPCGDDAPGREQHASRSTWAVDPKPLVTGVTEKERPHR